MLRESKRLDAVLIGYNEVPSIPKLVEVEQHRQPLPSDLNVQENVCSRDPPAIPLYISLDANPHTTGTVLIVL